MSQRQRYYTSTIPDLAFNQLIERLMDSYGIEKHSELITRLVVEAGKKVKS